MNTLTKLSKALVIILLLTTCSKDSSGGNDNPVTNPVAKYNLTVNVTPEGSGNITPKSGTFERGEQVTITATPISERFDFKNWTGGVTESSKTLTITMDSDKDITANFEEIPPVYINGSGIVGVLGGIIKIEDDNSPLNGIELKIPAGSLETAQEISISIDSESPTPYEKPVQLIKFEPSGLTFNEEVEITFPIGNDIEDLSEVGIYFYDSIYEIVERIESDEADQEKRTITGYIDHFSTYYIDDNGVSLSVKMLDINGTIGAQININGFKDKGTGLFGGLKKVPVTRNHINGTGDAHNYLWDCLIDERNNWNSFHDPFYSNFTVELHDYDLDREPLAVININIEKKWRNESLLIRIINIYNNSIYQTSSLDPIDDDKGLYLNGLGAWFSGRPFLFRFDNITPNSSTEYYIKAYWRVNNTVSDSDDPFVANYKFQKVRKRMRLAEMEDGVKDQNNNSIDDNFEPGNEDGDNDDVPNNQDNCPDDYNPKPQNDFDGDGIGDACDPDIDNDDVLNSQDLCDYSAPDATVNEDGCSNSDTDTDGDNVFDDVDQCPNTPIGSGEVDEDGCALPEKDSDGDGVFDDIDLCPNTPEGTESVDNNGCGELSVINPNAGTIWNLGQQNVGITWNPSDLGGSVDIELWKGGNKLGTVNGNTPTLNDGSFSEYDVQPPLAEGTDYSIKINSIEFPDKIATSAPFEIRDTNNLAPEAPFDPFPADEEQIARLNETLFWSASDPEGDPLTYDVYFGPSPNPPLVPGPPGQKEDTYDVTLVGGQTYYWKVVVKDDQGNVTEGPIWNFKVVASSSGELTVITKNAINKTPGSFDLVGEVATDGGLPILERGFYINFSGGIPTQNQHDDSISLTEGSPFIKTYSLPEIGLTLNYRAYATNSNGTALGEVISATYESNPPMVTITEPLNNSTYILGANITISGEVIDTNTNSYISEIFINVDGNAINNGNLDSQFTFQMGTNGYSLGTHEITIVATNEFGDSGTATVNITLEQSNSGTGTVTDIEGNTYQTITLGAQTWMAENLKTTIYNDGTTIPNITDNTAWAILESPGYSWYDNDAPTYKNVYGALYNWYAVSTGKLCPMGWHVPSDEEWKQLEMYLGMSQIEAENYGLRGANEGSKLAGNAALWLDGALETNEAFGYSGFNALPSGYREYTGIFRFRGARADWWSKDNSTAANPSLQRALVFTDTAVYRNNKPKEDGICIRCVKD